MEFDGKEGLSGFPSQKTTIALVGRFQTGKSTLVNCLLDDRVARTGTGTATTRIPTTYVFGEYQSVQLRHGDGRRTRGLLKDFIAPRFDGRGVISARISLWKPLLHAIDLVDTPGFDADKQDSARAISALDGADHAVLLLNNEGLSFSERKVLTEIRKRCMSFSVIVNCTRSQSMRWSPRHNMEILESLSAELENQGHYPVPLVDGHGIWACNLLWFWYASEHIHMEENTKEAVERIEHYLVKKLKESQSEKSSCAELAARHSHFTPLRQSFMARSWNKERVCRAEQYAARIREAVEKPLPGSSRRSAPADETRARNRRRPRFTGPQQRNVTENAHCPECGMYVGIGERECSGCGYYG